MPGRGRGRATRRDPGRGGRDEPKFEAVNPEQQSGFDNLDETKFGKKVSKISKFGNLLGGNSGVAADIEKELEEDLGLLDVRPPLLHPQATGWQRASASCS
jgi:hypothetical protein